MLKSSFDLHSLSRIKTSSRLLLACIYQGYCLGVLLVPLAIEKLEIGTVQRNARRECTGLLSGSNLLKMEAVVLDVKLTHLIVKRGHFHEVYQGKISHVCTLSSCFKRSYPKIK